MRDQAEALLAESRARTAAARAAGQSYVVAVHQMRTAQALVLLDRPAEALPELDAAQAYIDLLRADGQHDHQRMLHMVSASLPPPSEAHGDLGELEAWILVGRAMALTRLGRWADARAIAQSARPLSRGWSRRNLRRTLDGIDAEIARADGTSREALGALDRVVADTALSESQRRQARYERAAHLSEQGQFDDAMREALLLVRDADDDPALAARARQVLGAALAGLGRDDDANATLREAFEGFRRLDDHSAVVAAAPGLAWRLVSTGDPAAGCSVLESALPSARSLGDEQAACDLQAALGTARDAQGDSRAAVTAFTESIRLAEILDDTVRAADARHGEAIVRIRAADPHEAVEALSLLDQARGAYAAAGLPERAAECSHESAALLGRLGSYDAAAARYAIARDEYRAIPDVLRGDDPGALADCEYNLVVLTALANTPQSPPPPDAFGSGGHLMQHQRTAT